MKSALITLTAIALAVPAAPAFASGPFAQDVLSIRVDYSDLNLASPKGQKRLERRLESAARRVCGYYPGFSNPRMSSDGARKCYVQAKAGAYSQFAAVVERHAKGG